MGDTAAAPLEINRGDPGSDLSSFQVIPKQLFRYKSALLVVGDAGAWTVGLSVGIVLRLGFPIRGFPFGNFVVLLGLVILTQLLVGMSVGNYRGRYQVGSFDELTTLVGVWVSGAFAAVFVNYLVLGRPVPTTGLVSGAVLTLLTMAGIRAAWRGYVNARAKVDAEGRKRFLVFGAGAGGRQIIRALQGDPLAKYSAVAVLDDDTGKASRVVEGVPVVGSRLDIVDAAERYRAGGILIAIPSVSKAVIGEIGVLGREAGLDVMVLPDTSSLMGMFALGSDIRPMKEAELLGRDEVEVDLLAISDYIEGKRVLVTGAGGSIGSELCRQLSEFGPSRLMMLDRDESALHGVQLSIEGRALLDSPDLIIGNIRDRDRVFEIFAEQKPEVVFHTAALKHLPLLERHPAEGIKTNILGSKNLIDAAHEHEVERFVNISTDKAADPTSVLGTTKRLAECYASYVAGYSNTSFVSVRFGNVLGSRGSVVPTFLSQIENGGPVTVTDPEVTRYFMTIPEAVRLVVQSGAIGSPGETMILDMGDPVKILDLAKRLIAHHGPGTPIEFTGLRPAEKMHEILTSQSELGRTKSHSRINHTRVVPCDVAHAADWIGLPPKVQAKQLLDEVARIDARPEAS